MLPEWPTACIGKVRSGLPGNKDCGDQVLWSSIVVILTPLKYPDLQTTKEIVIFLSIYLFITNYYKLVFTF